MFENCQSIREVLKRLLELSKSFPEYPMTDVLLETCANKIVMKFKKQIMAEMYQEQKEEGFSALDESIPSRNPLSGKLKFDE
jgi:hypothetical protein